MTLMTDRRHDLLGYMGRMIELLSASGQSQWAKALTNAISEEESGQSVERFVLSLYGGMGSLNDVVLYVNGEAIVQLNDEFDGLRTRVFELCLESIQRE